MRKYAQFEADVLFLMQSYNITVHPDDGHILRLFVLNGRTEHP
jgi:hypothetical protein